MNWSNSYRDSGGNPTWRTYIVVALALAMVPFLTVIAVVLDLTKRK